MKHKILSGMMLLAAVFTAACSSDDDYAASSSAVVTSITTGEASVSAISATAYGTVQDLSSLNASTYQVGTVFSTAADPTNGGTRQLGAIDHLLLCHLCHPAGESHQVWRREVFHRH